MRDPMEVLRFKEKEIERVREEIEALKLVAPLLDDDGGSRKEAKPGSVPRPGMS